MEKKVVPAGGPTSMSSAQVFLILDKVNQDLRSLTKLIDDEKQLQKVDSFLQQLTYSFQNDTLYLNKLNQNLLYHHQLLIDKVDLSVEEKYFEKMDKVIESKNLDSYIDKIHLTLILKASRSNYASVLWGKLTWLFIALVPIFSMFMKLLYLRTKRFYTEHLIFTLELFSAFNFIICAIIVWMMIVCKLSILPLFIGLLTCSIFFLFSLNGFIIKIG